MAIVMRNAPQPVSIVGNTAVSANPDDKVVLLMESSGTLSDNNIVHPEANTSAAR